jgi:hypothetical protein
MTGESHDIYFNVTQLTINQIRIYHPLHSHSPRILSSLTDHATLPTSPQHVFLHLLVVLLQP